MRQQLPADFTSAAIILEGALGRELDGETGMFTDGYWLIPVARFVEEFGTGDWEASMRLCEAVTKRHTAEYAVRPFLDAETERTLVRMSEWSASPNPHVRALPAKVRGRAYLGRNGSSASLRTQWIVRRGLRSLAKKGDSAALALRAV